MSYTTKYKFTKFDDMKLDGEYNFYGIIFDASFPIYSETPFPHYECTLKLIDDSLDFPNDFNDEDYITLIIKSQNKEEIPFIHFIGDVIRVISGIYQNKKKRYIYLNFMNEKIIEKSYWSIYRNNIYEPLMCSKHDFSFEFYESSIISYLFEYYLFISNKLKYPKKINLIDRNEKGSDNDALVMIVNKTELDDQLVFDIQDETDGCQLHTYKYFNFINNNDVVRLRSFKIFDSENIVMNAYSNILCINEKSNLYKNFMNNMLDKAKKYNPSIIAEKFEIQTKFKKKDNLNLDNDFIVVPIMKEDEDEKDIPNKFLYIVKVFSILPNYPLLSSINILCKNCKYSYKNGEIDLKNDNSFYCDKCKNKVFGEPHFNMQIICRENNQSNDLKIFYLCNFDGEGNGFFGIEAKDIIKDTNKIKLLQEACNKIISNEKFIQIQVELNKNNFYRIVGNYKYNSD